MNENGIPLVLYVTALDWQGAPIPRVRLDFW